MMVSSVGSQSPAYYETEEFQSEEGPSDEVQGNEVSEATVPADGYAPATREVTRGVSVDSLKKELADWYEEVRQDQNLSYDKKNEVLLSIQDLQKNLSSGENTASQDVLDQFFLIQTEIAVAQGQAQEETEIGSLDHRLQTALSGNTFENGTKTRLEELQKELGQAKSALELASDPDAVNQAQGKVQEISQQVDEVLVADQSAHEEKTAKIQEEIEGLTQSMKDAHCSKKDKLRIAKKIAVLKAQVETGTVPLEEISEGLEAAGKELQQDVKAETHKDKLKAAYRGLSKHVPQTGVGSEEVAELADKISHAMEDGHWNRVENYLNQMTENDGWNTWESEVGIEQLIGTLYYGPAHESVKKLKKLLDLIPVKVREKMIDVIKLNKDGNRPWGVDDDQKQKRSNKIYGKKSETIHLLRDSIQESKKN